MRSRLALLLPVGLALAGCSTVQHLDPPPGAPASEPRARDSSIRVVAVRPPEIRYEDPAAEDLTDQIEASAHLIHVLRRTGLFERVDYTSEVGCPIDVEVAAIRSEDPRITYGPFWLAVATLSLAVLDSREGASFHPADSPDVRFDLPYVTRMYVGIVPLVASPLLATGLLADWEFLWAGPSTDENLGVMLRKELPRLAAHRGNAAHACSGASGWVTTPTR